MIKPFCKLIGCRLPDRVTQLEMLVRKYAKIADFWRRKYLRANRQLGK